MATYGYSTPYTGQRQPTLPPGYMEAATAPGRYIAAGIQQLGAGIGQALERYQQGRQESEYLNQRLESLAPYIAQTAGQAPEGSPEAKLVSSLEKYSGLSNAKKKALLADTEFFLRRKDDEVQRSIQQETLNRMRQEAQGGQDFINALSQVSQMVPGQGVQIPYASPTAQILSQYGRNLTPAQAQTLAEQIQIRTQAPPPGMVQTEATYKAPGGGQVTYTKPVSQTVESVPIPNTNMVQPMVGGKPVGSPIKQSTASKFGQEFDSLSESQQKFVESQWDKLNREKTVVEYREALSAYNEMAALSASKDITPADSLAMVYKFMKSLDPGSIVRETEVGLVVESGSIPQAIVQRLNQALTGNLTEEKRKMLLDASKKAMSGKVQSVNSLLDVYSKQSEKIGIPSRFTTEALRENLTSQDFSVAQEKPQGVELPRFNSIAEAEANLQPGQKAMVFDPAIRKRREFIKQ